ncbi:MAG: hypothetical protein U1E16_14575 [Hyphomicrobiales bacterium]
MTDDTHSIDAVSPDTDAATSQEHDAPSAAEPRSEDPGSRRKAQAAEPARRPPPTPPGQAKLQPSWVLSASGEQLTRDELLARYRRQRALPDDPFEHGGRPVPPPGYRDHIMNAPRPAHFMKPRQEEPEAAPAATPHNFTLGQTIAIATAMSLVAGTAAAVVSMHYSGSSSASAGSAAQALSAPPPVAADAAQPARQLQLSEAGATHDTVIDKKPVSTATLQVADVTGETNSFIPLALHAEPGGLDRDMLLKISGVPKDAYLTSGHRQDDQIWALSLAETRNVKLMVPQASQPQIDLAVAAFEPSTGELAAPVKTMTVALKDVVVEPTSAPPPGQSAAPAPASKSALPAGSAALPVAIPQPQSVSVALALPETSATQELIGKADQLLSSGDVQSARKSYERAWGNDGSAAAAFGIARSYDPLVLASLARNNATADKDQAVRWYQRAALGGNADAAEAIVRLQLKP